MDTRWYVMGMRGTGSHDVAVTNKVFFVPTTRTFPLVPGVHPPVPLSGLPLPVSLSRHCRVQSAAAPARGGAARDCGGVRAGARQIARGGEHRVFRNEPRRKPGWLGGGDLARGCSVFPLRYPERDVGKLTIAGETLSLKKADVLLAMTHAVQSAVQAVDLMYRVAGTSRVCTKTNTGAPGPTAPCLRRRDPV